MTTRRLLIVAVLVWFIHWAPQWMPASSTDSAPQASPVLHGLKDMQAASGPSTDRKNEALQRTLREADQHRDSLSPEQRAMIEELKVARGEATRARVVQNLVRTLEQEKRRTLSFYEWAAGVWQYAQESYEDVQPQAQSSLWAFAFLMVALGITAALRSQISLARWSAQLGFRVSRGWLVILSFLAIALAMVTRTNPWPAFPSELVLPPLLALVGCSIALRMVDLNYPVWNSLVRGCGAPLISMAFVATFLRLV